MKTLISFQNKLIPVYFSEYNKSTKRAMENLLVVLEKKITHGKRALKKCLDTLISIEIVNGEAILHTKRESDTLALSLY